MSVHMLIAFDLTHLRLTATVSFACITDKELVSGECSKYDITQYTLCNHFKFAIKQLWVFNTYHLREKHSRDGFFLRKFVFVRENIEPTSSVINLIRSFPSTDPHCSWICYLFKLKMKKKYNQSNKSYERVCVCQICLFCSCRYEANAANRSQKLLAGI